MGPLGGRVSLNTTVLTLHLFISQTIFVKKNIIDFDAVRTLRNGFIGLCFGPLRSSLL
jgi:protein Mpv17